MKRSQRYVLLLLVVLAVSLLVVIAYGAANFAPQGGKTYADFRYPKTLSVLGGYQYFCSTISPVGVEAGIPWATRYQIHHRMLLGSDVIPTARIDIYHANTGLDTLRVKAFFGATGDTTLVWVTALADTQTFYIAADSISYRPYKTSAAGDWQITTYFAR